MDWQSVELLGYSHYTSQGYQILTSLVRNDAYDFVVRRDGKFVKVNVKQAGLKNKNIPNSWCIAQASGPFDIAAAKGQKQTSEVDVYLAYPPETQKFIELSGNLFEGVASKS
jgi:hypothetical protein